MSASAEAIAAAVASCPGVVRLSPGGSVEVATYLPRQRVVGVRLRDEDLDVRVVPRAGTVRPDLAADIRRAVEPIAPGRAIDVHIDDIDVEPQDAMAEPGARVPSSAGAEE